MKYRKKLSKELIQHYAHKTFQNFLYVKLHSNMFRWRPPSASSRKSISTNQNTAIVNCLSYMHTVKITSRPHQYRTCWIQLSNNSVAAENRGNPENSIWHILVCVFVCVCVCVCAYLRYAYHVCTVVVACDGRVCRFVGSGGPVTWCIHLC
jgi:hypothetical protein